MKEIISKFYTAFANFDAETMCSCYHDDIIFEDPAFGRLEGAKVKNMWRMLCDSQKGKTFIVNHHNIVENGRDGTVSWEAIYTFSQTGRKIHNKINAQFKFKEGLIVSHVDRFNLHKWARQAMGLKGFLLGGTSFFKKQLKQKTNALLNKYEQKIDSMK